MYPTPDEAAVLEAVEAFMVKTMAQYDPSHDALHGESKSCVLKASFSILYTAYSPTCSQDCTKAVL